MGKYPIRIDLPFLDTSERRDSTAKECYLNLHEKFVEYKIQSRYEELNEDTDIWEAKSANWRFVRSRALISEVSMIWSGKEAKWVVEMAFNSGGQLAGWHFSDFKEARRVYEELINYFTEGAVAYRVFEK